MGSVSGSNSDNSDVSYSDSFGIDHYINYKEEASNDKASYSKVAVREPSSTSSGSELEVKCLYICYLGNRTLGYKTSEQEVLFQMLVDHMEAYYSSSTSN